MRLPSTRVGHAIAERAEAQVVHEFLGFVVADERYALPLACVREIARVPDITEVPRAPAGVLGVIAVRGAVTTLIDLHTLLALPVTPITARTRVLLVDHGEERLGLLCDHVLQVYRFTADEVELASVLGNQASAHVVGIGRPGHGRKQASVRSAAVAAEIVILLDPVALLRRHARG